jgi:hypothetical protein
MCCFYDVAIEFDESASWENVTKGMQCPFDKIQRWLIEKEGVRFDTAYRVYRKEVLMFYVLVD